MLTMRKHIHLPLLHHHHHHQLLQQQDYRHGDREDSTSRLSIRSHNHHLQHRGSKSLSDASLLPLGLSSLNGRPLLYLYLSVIMHAFAFALFRRCVSLYAVFPYFL